MQPQQYSKTLNFSRIGFNLKPIMKKLLKLMFTGLFAGFVLMLLLKIVMVFTGNTAYVLLFNFDYVPLIKDLKPIWLFGYFFHFLTCIISVIVLFYILNKWILQKVVFLYILIYMIGGGALFFLTTFSDQPPASSDLMAWVYWTLAHAVFGYTVGILIKKLI